MASHRRVKGLGTTSVIEIELGGGPRLVAHVGGGAATLLAIGDHEVVGRYARRGNVASDLRTAEPLPPQFSIGHKDAFFPAAGRRRPGQLTPWGPEISPEWVYFLDEEQMGVCDGVVENAEDVLLADDLYQVHFIVGGPGTGKTSILLQLLRRLTTQVEAGAENWTAALMVSDRVAAYITASTGWDLGRSRTLAKSLQDADILLVDDPESDDVIRRLTTAVSIPGWPRVLVIAVDPLQLAHRMSDGQYRTLVGGEEVLEWVLRASYRQKENVGRSALSVANVVAASSPFLDDTKRERYARESRSLTRLANDLLFRNPSGYAASHPEATLTAWRDHLAWIGAQRGLWQHWPPLLVVVDEDTTLPKLWRAELQRVEHERVALRDIATIKGLEYQHVMLLLSAARYDDITEGFSGTGRRLYDEYRLLRIPFSRAKDSLAIFVRR
jgi:hypothetical protein